MSAADLAPVLSPPSSERAGPGPLPRPAPIAVSIPVAAEMLGVSRDYLSENYVDLGVPYVRLGRRVVVPVAALCDWLAGRTTTGKAA